MQYIAIAYDIANPSHPQQTHPSQNLYEDEYDIPVRLKEEVSNQPDENEPIYDVPNLNNSTKRTGSFQPPDGKAEDPELNMEQDINNNVPATASSEKENVKETQPVSPLSLQDFDPHKNGQLFTKSSKEKSIILELTNTEKTNIRDLAIVSTHLKNYLESCQNFTFKISSNQPLKNLLIIYSQFYMIHKNFLENLERHLQELEQGSNSCISFSENSFNFFKKFLASLNNFVKSYNEDFRVFIEEHIRSILYYFVISPVDETETQLFGHLSAYQKSAKVCYKSFGYCLLKPLIRVGMYLNICKELSSSFSSGTGSSGGSNLSNQLTPAINILTKLSDQVNPILTNLYNEYLTSTILKDLENVSIQPTESSLVENKLIKYGSLFKLTENGYDQRLFFIFGNNLVYTGKGFSEENRFVVRGEVGLNGCEVMTKEEEPKAFRLRIGVLKAQMPGSPDVQMLRCPDAQ